MHSGHIIFQDIPWDIAPFDRHDPMRFEKGLAAVGDQADRWDRFENIINSNQVGLGAVG